MPTMVLKFPGPATLGRDGGKALVHPREAVVTVPTPESWSDSPPTFASWSAELSGLPMAGWEALCLVGHGKLTLSSPFWTFTGQTVVSSWDGEGSATLVGIGGFKLDAGDPVRKDSPPTP